MSAPSSVDRFYAATEPVCVRRLIRDLRALDTLLMLQPDQATVERMLAVYGRLCERHARRKAIAALGDQARLLSDVVLGRLHPAAYAIFRTPRHRWTLKLVRTLSIEDQGKLATALRIEVVRPNAVGRIVEREVAPRLMSYADAFSVIRDGKLLSADQQRCFLEREGKPRVRIDRRRGGIIVGPMFVSLRTLERCVDTLQVYEMERAA